MSVDKCKVQALSTRLSSAVGGPIWAVEPPYIHQRTPAGAPSGFDGSASCGPACMAMIARSLGYRRSLTDHQLIVRFGLIGRTTLELGTEPSGIVAIARELGKTATVRKGSDLELLKSALRRGSMVVVNGEYYAMPPHEDPDEREGHWILAYGLAPNGDFLVHDSEDPLIRTVTPRAMKKYLVEHDKGGVQVEIELQRASTPTKKGGAPTFTERTY